MSVSLQLRLDERQDDRVFVSVTLDPDGIIQIEGVALELHCRQKHALSPRLLLPVAGQLTGSLTTQVELRAARSIPQGAVVVATVWVGDQQFSAMVPTDPCTGMEGHVRGCPRVSVVPDDRDLASLSDEQVSALRGAMPWIGQPVIQDDDDDDAIDDAEMDHLCAELGLDGECAEWLRDLMAEDC